MFAANEGGGGATGVFASEWMGQTGSWVSFERPSSVTVVDLSLLLKPF